MNYATHYALLISRAKDRTLHGYSERHHVVPRCLGGDDSPDNVVRLTAEEHFVAHQILVKIHPLDHRIAHAAAMMANTRPTNKFYGWLRRKYSEARRTEMLGKKMPPRTAEHSAKLGRKGHKRCVGRVLSPETRAKIGSANRGRKLTPEHRQKLTAALIGNQRTRGLEHSAESRAKMSSAHRGIPKSPEHRAKIAAARVAYWKRLREGERSVVVR